MKNRLTRACLTALAMISFPACLAGLAAEPVDFARHVLPVLSDKCFVCHGPAGEHRDVLRLDSFVAATRDLGGHRAIDPARPEKSEILVRLLSDGDPMPPADAEKQLTPRERELLQIGVVLRCVSRRPCVC